MLRSTTAFWGRCQIERLLMAKHKEKQQPGRGDPLRRADGRGHPSEPVRVRLFKD
jgi:hypothetical protein